MKRSYALRRRYSHGRKRAGRIVHVIGATITHYGDTGDVTATIRWQDENGSEGETSGDPNNPHMQALLDRAVRGGVRIQHVSSGRVYGPQGSWVVPPSQQIPERFR